MRNSWKLGFAVLGIVAPAAFAQQSVEWDVSRSVLAGSGCRKDVDAFITQNGNDLSVVFTQLSVNLPGNQSPVTSSRKSCTTRVPATIAPGYYIGKLSQRVSFGATKTARTRASISTASQFFGFNVSPYTVDVPYGRALNEPLLTQERVDYFRVNTHPSWYSGWCARNRAPKGLYQANLVVSGMKDSAREDLIVGVDGLDVKYEVVAGMVQCQL